MPDKRKKKQRLTQDQQQIELLKKELAEGYRRMIQIAETELNPANNRFQKLFVMYRNVFS